MTVAGDTTLHAETIVSSVTGAGPVVEVGVDPALQWGEDEGGRQSIETTETGTRLLATPTKRATGNVPNAISTTTPDEHVALNVTEQSQGAAGEVGARPDRLQTTGRATGSVAGVAKITLLTGLSVSDVAKESRDLAGGGPPTSLYL